MKKIISVIMIMLVSTICSSNNPHPTREKKDRFHLVVEGSFLNQKNVNYTVFEMDKEGTFVSTEHVKARKYFSLQLDVNAKYIIRFEDKKHNVKFLIIDAARSGHFVVDVDFSKPHDAILRVTKVGYAITPLINGAPPALAKN